MVVGTGGVAFFPGVEPSVPGEEAVPWQWLQDEEMILEDSLAPEWWGEGLGLEEGPLDWESREAAVAAGNALGWDGAERVPHPLITDAFLPALR